MKRIVLTVFLMFFAVALLPAQQNVNQEIRVKKIDVDLNQAPRYTIQGSAPQADPTAKWLIVVAELESTPEWADEVTVRFYVVANYGANAKGDYVPADKFDVLACSVTVVNMQKNFPPTGKKNFVPVFMDANTVKKYGASSKTQFIPEVAVQVMYKGKVQDTKWMQDEKKSGRFWEAKQVRGGILLNLLQSPWFPAYAEFYEQVKPSSSAPVQ